MAHLICVAHTRLELADILVSLRKAGVENLMALGGDPPEDPDAAPGARLRQRVGRTSPCHRRLLGRCGRPPGGPSPLTPPGERPRFLGRQARAGRLRCYPVLLRGGRVRGSRVGLSARGVHTRVLPGDPAAVTSLSTMARLGSMAAAAPAGWRRRLRAAINAAAPTPSARKGSSWPRSSVRDSLARNVPGLHFYTFNASNATREIYAAWASRRARGEALRSLAGSAVSAPGGLERRIRVLSVSEESGKFDPLGVTAGGVDASAGPPPRGNVVRGLLENEGFPPQRVVVVVNGAGGLDDPSSRPPCRWCDWRRNFGPGGGIRGAGMLHAFAGSRYPMGLPLRGRHRAFRASLRLEWPAWRGVSEADPALSETGAVVGLRAPVRGSRPSGERGPATDERARSPSTWPPGVRPCSVAGSSKGGCSPTPSGISATRISTSSAGSGLRGSRCWSIPRDDACCSRADNGRARRSDGRCPPERLGRAVARLLRRPQFHAPRPSPWVAVVDGLALRGTQHVDCRWLRAPKSGVPPSMVWSTGCGAV